MKCCVVLTGLCIVSVFLLPWQSSLCRQESLEKAKPKPKVVEGVWTEITHEIEGEIISMLPELPPLQNARPRGHYLWKITKDTIEMGPDRKDVFPLFRYSYKLKPENHEDAIDMLPLGKDQGKYKILAIYHVKGDYLMICKGRSSRPKAFTSSEQNPAMIYILRRGELNKSNIVEGSKKLKRKEK